MKHRRKPLRTSVPGPVVRRPKVIRIPEAVAPSNSFNASLDAYRIQELEREVTRLRSLAYVAPAGPDMLTWQERAAQLETQLALAAPGVARNLDIRWQPDEHDCETCGSSWAEGAEVYLNGTLILSRSPIAACFDAASYSADDIYRAILDHLGFAIKHEPVEQPLT